MSHYQSTILQIKLERHVINDNKEERGETQERSDQCERASKQAGKGDEKEEEEKEGGRETKKKHSGLTSTHSHLV